MWLLKWDAYGNFYKSQHRYTSSPTAYEDRDYQMSRLKAYAIRLGIDPANAGKHPSASSKS